MTDYANFGVRKLSAASNSCHRVSCGRRRDIAGFFTTTRQLPRREDYVRCKRLSRRDVRLLTLGLSAQAIALVIANFVGSNHSNDSWRAGLWRSSFPAFRGEIPVQCGRGAIRVSAQKGAVARKHSLGS